jgi:hypothetical protein
LSTVLPRSNTGIFSTESQIGAGVYLVVISFSVMASDASQGAYAPNRLAFTPMKFVLVTRRTAFSLGHLQRSSARWPLASAAANIVAGGATGITQANGSTAGESSGPLASFVDSPLRSSPAAKRSDAVDVAAARGEFDRLFTARLGTCGDFSSADRSYLAEVVETSTELNQARCEKQVSQVIAQAKSAVDKGRQTAARFALWLTASPLFGAFSASIVAREGGGVGDITSK